MAAHAKIGGERNINATYAGKQHQAEVTVLADGRFVVIWLTGDTTAAEQSVLLRLFNADGTPAGGEITVATSPLNVVGLTITGLAGGGFVAAWNADNTVVAQVFNSNGAATSSFITVSSNGASADVIALANGGFALSWQGISAADLSGTSVHMQTYNASGTPTSGDLLVNTTLTGNQESASIAALANGGIVVTWFDNGNTATGADDRIKGQIFTAAGVRVGGEFAITLNLALQSPQSQVTALSNGNFAVAWLEYDAALGTNETHMQIFSPTGARVGSEIEVPYRLSLDNTGWAEITELANGDIAIAWTANDVPTSDGSERGIFVQVYNADGTPASATMQVNTQANGMQSDPAIAALDNGGFVITWTDFNGAGDDDDEIKMQIFGPPDASNPIGISSNGGGAAAALSLAENTGAVTTVAASGGVGPLSYAILGGADAARFSINATTGALIILGPPDFEAPTDAGANNVYDVVVSVSDGSRIDSQAIAVTVTNVNEAPVITSNGGGASAAISVNENATAVTTFLASDPENAALTYSIAGGADAVRFAINASTGALRFVSAPNFEAPADVGANNVYDVIVRASDGSLTNTQAIAVTVANVNEFAPVISSNGAGASASISVPENSTALTIVVASDADRTGVTYAVAGGVDAARFTINAATGALSFVSTPDFEAPTDVGTNNVYDVIVSASDGSLTDTQTLAVTVTNVKEASIITSNGGGDSAGITVNENSTFVTTVTSIDPEDTTQIYSISGGADAALFTIGSKSGVLSFVSAPNFEAPTDAGGNNVYDVIVRSKHGNLTDTQAIAVTVANLNEFAPVISSNGGGASASVSVAENTTAVTTVAASDADGTAPSYSIAGGVDAARFTIDAATGALSFLSAPNFEAPTDVGANNVYDVIVRASDGNLTDTQALAVSMTNVNEVPVITSNGGGDSASVAVTENSVFVTAVTSSDPENTTRTYSIFGGADAARFTINAISGALSFVSAPNFEAPTDVGANNVYDVIVRASDGSLSDTQAIAVTVSDVNESAPVISSNGAGATASISVPENSTAVTTVVASDADGTGVTYAVAGGVDAARFTINAATGALSFVSPPDFEAPTDVGPNNVYDVIVSASDGSLTDTQALAISVTNVNEAVTIASGSSFTVAENTLAVTTVTSTDLDGTAPTYSIFGGVDAARFTINTSTGALSFISAPNFEAPTDVGANNVYDVIVRASDGSLSDTRAMAITVANANEAPVITSNGGGASASISVNENSTAVTSVVASDPEGTAPTYSIFGGADAARFAINASTGALSFLSGPNFEAPTDVGANNVYDVIVRASDGSLSNNQAIAVTVTNANEAPVITSNGGGASAAISVNENAAAVTTVMASDPESAALTYAISGGVDAARFTINASTGALSFVSAPDFEVPSDVGANNIYDVIVRASDGSLGNTQAIAVTVANVNGAPVITSNGGGASAALSISENSTAVTTVVASDPESPALSYSIAGGVDAARFTINAATGTLSFVSAPNFEAPTDVGANNVYDVIVSASDGGLTDTQALAVTVTNVNEAPVITSNGGGSTASVTVNENTTFVTAVTSTDPENTARTYSISGGADSALFTINASTGALSFTSGGNFESPSDVGGDNVYDVIVSASDGSLTDTQAIAVTVANVNEFAPVISSNGGGASASISVAENATAVTTVVASDGDGTGVTYALAGGVDAARFTINSSTGALSFLTAPNFEAPADVGGNNVYDVIVSASDGSLTDTQAIAVSVANVNEFAPLISSNGGGASASLTVSENSTTVTTVVASDADGTGVTYAISGGADAARFAIDANTGVLIFVSAPNFETPTDSDANNVYDVIVGASDGVLTDTQAIAVTVSNVNETPVITSNGGGASAALSVNENSTTVTTVLASDPEGGVTYTIAGGADAPLFTINTATGALSFIAAPNFEAPADSGANNVYDVIVSASDGSLTDTQALAVAVGNVNEAPAITSNGGGLSASITVPEDTTIATTVVALDPDGTGVTYAIAGGVDGARFAINASTGALSFVSAPNFEAPTDSGANNVYDVIVSASDGSLADTQAISVSVSEVAAPPNYNYIVGTAAPETLEGTTGRDHITGLGGQDYLYGDEGADFLVGGQGGDELTGGSGADAMFGGEGDDFFDVDDVGDVVVESADEGFDFIQASVSYTLGAHVEVLLLWGEAATDGTGNALDNFLWGSEHNNTLLGLGGNDLLDGSYGDDSLQGGDGDDFLAGGDGADKLTGGDGSDVFSFGTWGTPLGTGDIDTITDFALGEDTIELDSSIFTSLSPGALSASAFVVGSAAADASDRIIYNNATGSVYYDADGTGSGAAVEFAILASLPNLTASDIWVA